MLSKDGALVPWDARTRNVFVKDPDGLNLELVGTLPGARVELAPAGTAASRYGGAAMKHEPVATNLPMED